MKWFVQWQRMNHCAWWKDLPVNKDEFLGYEMVCPAMMDELLRWWTWFPTSDWAQKNYALAKWEGMAVEMFSSSAAFHTRFNRMSLIHWKKALVHLLLKSCYKIESNLLKFTRAQDWMLSRTSRALWWCGGMCVWLGIMSNLLENNGDLSEVGSN